MTHEVEVVRSAGKTWHRFVREVPIVFQGITFSARFGRTDCGLEVVQEERMKISSYDDLPKPGRFPRVCSRCSWPDA